MSLTPLRRGALALVACGCVALTGWSGLALASGPPSPSTLQKIGSPPSAAQTEPLIGLGATPFTQPLIVVSIANGRASVLGGSAVKSLGSIAHVANIPISAVACSVNFTTHKTPITVGTGKAVSVRWFGGIACNRHVEMFGEAFLAQSATNFSGTGNYYSGQLASVSSGRPNTIVGGSNPSLYVWHATNVYFQEKPSRGVIVISPSPGQQINAATSCKAVKSSKFGFGVHCDLYSQRF